MLTSPYGSPSRRSPPPAPYSAKLQALVDGVYSHPAVVAFIAQERKGKK